MATLIVNDELRAGIASMRAAEIDEPDIAKAIGVSVELLRKIENSADTDNG
jgi:hypothetical protein